MKNSKYLSHQSTPLSSIKQNICPNSKTQNVFNGLKLNTKKNLSPSLGTDSQFSVFNTINIKRKSINNSVATKSRVQIEAILQNFSTKSSSPNQPISNVVVSHKSFLGLLGVMLGREDISVEEAIQKCEQYQISGRDELLSIMQQKEISHEWPLPLSNLLLTELGQLKIRKICQHLQNEEQLDEGEIQIVEFLVARSGGVQSVSGSHLLQLYNQFRNRIDQKCNIADQLVKTYSLRVEPKIRALKDKILLIKSQKRILRMQKQNGGKITFKQLQSCVQSFKLTEQEVACIFKYLYWLQNQKILSLIDRKQTVKCQTCLRQLFLKYKSDIIPIQTLSTIQFYEEQTNTVINQLLNDKSYLLETVDKKDSQLEKLKNKLAILQLELECRERQHLEQKARELDAMRKRYDKTVNNLKEQCMKKDNMIKWYQNELSAIVKQNQIQWITKNRQRLFLEQYQHNKERKSSGDKESQKSATMSSEQSFYDLYQ